MTLGSSSPTPRVEVEERLQGGYWGRNEILRRRIWIAGAVGALSVIGLIVLALILQSGGWGVGDSLIFITALMLFPILALEVVTSAIGFGLCHVSKSGHLAIAPFNRRSDLSPALTAKTAIVMVLHNDAVEDAIQRLKLLRTSLERTGEGGHFAFYLLSDTSDPVLAKREDDLVREWNKALPDFAPLIYRRRLVSARNKSEVLIDFCRQWGEDFEFVVPLDVASFMTGPAIVHLVRIMQAHPKIGIVQSLILPLSGVTAFARIVGFGERYQARVKALGFAWWHADCALYQGRNAILRIAPYYLHCRIPYLSGQDKVSGFLSEPQIVEAALLRRAGYEIVSLPIEAESYADCPDSIFQYVRQKCARLQSEWQLARFLKCSDFAPIYRMAIVQRLIAAMVPLFWIISVVSFALKAFENYEPIYLSEMGVKASYFAFLSVLLAPRIFGALDSMMRADRIRNMAVSWRFFVSAVSDIIIALLLQPVFMFRAAFAVVDMPLRRLDHRSDAPKDNQQKKRNSAFKSFWPVSLFGVDLILFMLIGSPDYTRWSLPLILGFLVAVPMVAILSSRWMGHLITRFGLFQYPESSAPPRELSQLKGRDLHD